MGLDATFRTINADATTERERYYGVSTTPLATFRKFHPLHTWVAENVKGAEVTRIDGFPVFVTAELTANDIKRFYAYVTNYFGAPSHVDGDVPHALSMDVDLLRVRQAYNYALEVGANTPSVLYAGDC